MEEKYFTYIEENYSTLILSKDILLKNGNFTLEK